MADDLVHDPGHVVGAEERKARRSMTLRLAGGGVVAVALVAFVFQNTEVATFSFLTFQFETGLWTMLLVTLLLGFLLGYGVRQVTERRRSRKKG